MFRDAKVGDKVWRPTSNGNGEWGEISKVHSISEATHGIYVRFDGGERSFTARGCEIGFDGFPAIFWAPVQLPPLPTRPKRKVKKTVEGWLNVYVNPYWNACFHLERDEADRNQIGCNKRIACVHVTGEYEVEE
jgi:hypothetical protein